MAACGHIYRTDLALGRGPAAAQHLAHASREQQIRVLAAQDEHGTLDLVPHMPTRDVEHQRPGEGPGDRRIVVLAVAAVVRRDGAVLGEVPPLGVAERSEMGVDLAQIRFHFGDRSKPALDAQIFRDAMQRDRGDAGAEVVEYEPPDRRSRQHRELHADVPAERAADPIDLAHAEARDERAHRR